MTLAKLFYYVLKVLMSLFLFCVPINGDGCCIEPNLTVCQPHKARGLGKMRRTKKQTNWKNRTSVLQMLYNADLCDFYMLAK